MKKKTRKILSAIMAGFLIGILLCGAVPAEAASSTNIKFGDVNGDGIIDLEDIELVNSYRLGNVTLEPWQIEAGDVNQDGVVDLSDLNEINIG